MRHRSPSRAPVHIDGGGSDRRYGTARRSFLIAGAAAAAASLLKPGPAAWAAVADPGSGVALAYDGPLIAVKDVQLIDGTGRPACQAMTLLIENGKISAIGPASQVAIPSGAQVIDGAGKTILPGLVMMHEHIFYPTGPGPWRQNIPSGNFTEMLATFPPLYLAGGVTTIRTAGTMSADGDLNLSAAIARGDVLGPDVHVTGPYINGPTGGSMPFVAKMPGLTSPADAVRLVDYWAGTGVRSFKAYMTIDRAMLRESIRAAHRHGATVTGHLGKVTYREAALLGIDNLEHGFAVASDFVPGKQPDVAPPNGAVDLALANVDPDSPELRQLMELLISRNIPLTSTLVVFETTTPGRPQVAQGALDLLMPALREQYLTTWQQVQQSASPWIKGFPNELQLERLFVERGGTLMAGTDPTGIGGILPGFAGKRQVQLMVEAGFPIERAIRFASLEGARFLKRDKEIGSIEVGKRADLALVDGDPVRDIRTLERMPLVFKAGKGYRTGVIFSAMQGSVGLN